MPIPERYPVTRESLQQTAVQPVTTRLTEGGACFVDFGKAAFGTLLLSLRDGVDGQKLAIHLGEQLTADGRLERAPAGTIRYVRIEQVLTEAQGIARIVIPSDPRNTGPGAVQMPEEIGEVFPFRYAEIEPAEAIDVDTVRQVRVHYPFDDAAATFDCSDDVLNAVYELCKYSIKATTFCGVYVDGDRERIPYEGDAYINQLSHYCVDSAYGLARYTHEYLIQHPTWPTEWQLHSVMMAWADYLYTGETASLARFYDDLCVKTLIGLARDDGLISTESDLCTREFERRLGFYGPSYIFSHGLRDVVDWPPGSFTDGGQGERDNYEMLSINTVPNAFHCHALALMSRIARVLDRTEDQDRFSRQAALVKASINSLLFDQARGIYVDGEGSEHASLHSNMFVLAFDLVPEDRIGSVVSFVKSRGMACSVYGAQHLLEALYRNGEAQAALDLMTARHDRSWWHMMEVGSTITLEAWDIKYKNNLDWNHAWGAAPANIIPRYVLGVRPLEPGFRRMLICPQPGALERVSGVVPTIRGPVTVSLETGPTGARTMEIDIPAGATAKVGLRQRGSGTGLVLDGRDVEARLENGILFVDNVRSGEHVLVSDSQT